MARRSPRSQQQAMQRCSGERFSTVSEQHGRQLATRHVRVRLTNEGLHDEHSYPYSRVAWNDENALLPDGRGVLGEVRVKGQRRPRYGENGTRVENHNDLTTIQIWTNYAPLSWKHARRSRRDPTAARAGRHRPETMGPVLKIEPDAMEPELALVRPRSMQSTAERTMRVASPAIGGTIETVYRDRYSSLVRLAALTTGSVAHAEEIVQDAFVQLYRRWDQVQEPNAWLRVAVLNGCRSWVRRRRLERRLPPPLPLDVTTVDGIEVRDALSALTTRQRAAVILRYFEGLSEAEIASSLGCRPGTVKSLLSRSMDKLQEVLCNDNSERNDK
jgi:RNA polymerase sigma-70 factor (sigma-E family)